MAVNCVVAVFDGGELCRRCVSRRRIEVAEMKVGEMCALNSTVTLNSESSAGMGVARKKSEEF